eukprot:c21152_g2_i1.p1 GENE.c21152_g2_i1~~c21152_g2_i1.p1  ORF type:complete len:540 (+),score=147.09 c21152_g2_i1:61-1680(+)
MFSTENYQKMNQELDNFGNRVQAVEKEIMLVARKLRLADHCVANIPVKRKQAPHLSQLSGDRWQSSHPVLRTYAEVVSDSTPRWLRKLFRKIDQITRIPNRFHINSMFKHAKKREFETQKLKPHFEEEVFEQIEPLEEHPVRFIYWISIIQIIIFIVSLFGEDGIAPFGIGVDVQTKTVPYLNNFSQKVQISQQKNMWFGADIGELIHFGSKYTPCMRAEKSFSDAKAKTKANEINYGCCVDQYRKCGQTTNSFCRSISSSWFNTTCAAKIADSSCNEITLRPCCYYIQNSCVVVSKEFCDVLPGPRKFHQDAEKCSDVACESTICGMGTLGSSDPEKPLQWWRFFTPIFMHVGVVHLIGNLFGQIAIGGDIESLCGFTITAFLYFISGIGGNMFAALMDPSNVSAGASSSIYGLVAIQTVDLLLSWPLVEHKCAQAMKMFFSTVLLLGIGTLPWIDNFAHFGGYIIGIVGGIAFIPHLSFSATDRLIKWLLSIQARVILLLLAIAVVILFYVINEQNFCPNCKYIDCIPYTSSLCGYT